MASDLLTIARSGVKAARIQLDITAQNITNASTEGYVRRSVATEEVVSLGYLGQNRDVSLSGVRVSGVIRNADAFRQAEVRRTGADTARADTEVTGLENINAALENSGVYDAITGFEAALQQLTQAPTDTPLRAATIAAAQTMATSFNIASNQLDAVAAGQQAGAADGVAQVNAMASELAQVNARLSRMADVTTDRSGLFDQRDKILGQMARYANIATSFAPDGSVAVTLGGTSGAPLVSGNSAQSVAITTAADGTITYAVNGGAVTLSGGSLAGQQQVLVNVADVHTRLDDLARTVVNTVNTAQAGGTALDGTAGGALFSGSTAATIAMATTQGSAIATAGPGAPAGSRDISNLKALQNALTSADPAGTMDTILYHASAAVQSRTTTRDALKTISDAAKTALLAQSGVDLDTEAINLTRFQQAFQASGRVIQVASDLFNSLLAIR
ncbi:MAG TPA: flagellar hook-associated protein FlgK [Novosphingobium capsulatum]|nr:flagellar hook-associated protein FlgK [Novosphingobium capsulatum]